MAATVEWSQPEPRRQAVCVAEGGAGEVTQVLWRSPEGMSGSFHWTVGIWFCFDLIVTVP